MKTGNRKSKYFLLQLLEKRDCLENAKPPLSFICLHHDFSLLTQLPLWKTLAAGEVAESGIAKLGRIFSPSRLLSQNKGNKKSQSYFWKPPTHHNAAWPLPHLHAQLSERERTRSHAASSEHTELTPSQPPAAHLDQGRHATALERQMTEMQLPHKLAKSMGIKT